MDNREIRKQIRLNVDEARLLSEKFKKANMCEAEFIRKLITTSIETLKNKILSKNLT